MYVYVALLMHMGFGLADVEIKLAWQEAALFLYVDTFWQSAYMCKDSGEDASKAIHSWDTVAHNIYEAGVW